MNDVRRFPSPPWIAAGDEVNRQPSSANAFDSRFDPIAVDAEAAGQLVALRNAAKHMAQTIARSSNPSREQSLAMTALEEASFWANRAIAMASEVRDGS